ncbi:hypothetical protein VHUM_00582 [Vanrija humicola]|uniref:FHA domain-containing protein n=1 Tax=Vanrija humicola TaxID=5417 RepID=A0A7D8Z4M4_VANHU|nr:hypothetical protein VHUM_00582 [Vanrija humicola]
MQQHQQAFHGQSTGQHAQAAGAAANQQPWGTPYPALHLWPIQDTFQMKMIHLPAGQRVKIGRQTNNKTVPGERNAYFDSKVLSRTHAEIWEQGGKIFIKDVKSSNGTFINGHRLSPEGVESEPFELKSEDAVEFGIDINSEDNRTIIHHKVSAKAYCVFNSEDAQASARNNNDPRNGLRRAPAGSMAQGNSANALSHMGQPLMSAGGKPNGLSFDHVLQKLQNELHRSKETTQELQGLNWSMTDVQDTLGGGLAPGQNGSAAQYIPAQFRNPSAEAQAALAGPHGPQAAAFISLQTQMTDTQSSLSGHLDRIRQLEGQLQQQDVLKQDIATIRQQMEASKLEVEALLASATRHNSLSRRNDDYDDDDDDARSVATVVPDDDEHLDGDKGSNGTKATRKTAATTTSEPSASSDELAARIQALTSDMAEAVQLSRSLHVQHTEAMAAVKHLTDRVGDLENGIADRVAAAVVQAEGRWEAWRSKFEERWNKERDGWEAERERLRGIVRDWEEASRRAVEEDEDREMNQHLSEDELDDEGEEEEIGQDDIEASELLAIHNRWPNGRTIESGEQVLDIGETAPSRSPGKPRRRRPSTKTSLAVRGLRSVASVAGASTPKAPEIDSPPSDAPRPRQLRGGALSRVKKLSGRDKFRSASLGVDKESSESGRESADTLRGEKETTGEHKVDNHAQTIPSQASHLIECTTPPLTFLRPFLLLLSLLSLLSLACFITVTKTE